MSCIHLKKSLISFSGFAPVKFCSSAESSLERFATDIAGPKILYEIIFYVLERIICLLLMWGFETKWLNVYFLS